MKNFVDLSHTIEEGLVTYKGLPAPIICDYLSREASKAHYEEGTSFHIGKIEMVANTGTYLDSPFHRYADGLDLSELELSSLAELEGIRINIPSNVKSIDEDFFQSFPLKEKAVLVCTKWSRHWNTEAYFEGHPYLTQSAAEYLVQQKVRLVGIDSYNIDDVRGGSRPVHSVLLKANIPIVEHLCNLEQIPSAVSFTFSAVPAKVRHFGTFPVRAYATYEGTSITQKEI